MYRLVLVVLLALCAIMSAVPLHADACIVGNLASPPTIMITTIPPSCPPGLYAGTLYGIANNVDTDSVDVVFYARTDKMYVQPVQGMPAHTPIACDGTFNRGTYCGEVYYALLVKKNWIPPATMWFLPTIGGQVLAIASNPDRQYRLSGREWWGKGSLDARIDPGPNYYSDSPEHVWTDGDGFLHLRLSKTDVHWRSPEAYSANAFPYGRFWFSVQGPVCDLDPRVVFSGFTYVTIGKEFDVEMALWGNAGDPNNAQYIVQPDGPGRRYRFHCPPENLTNHEMIWTADRITFASRTGGMIGSGDVIATWSFTGTGIPLESDSMRCHFNLWTLDSVGPSNQQPVEALITAFSFTPIAEVSVPFPETNPVVVLLSTPNPVRDVMRLTFNLPSAELVSINLYDV